MNDHKLDTHQKALALNLDNSLYGTIAEIGAGQEVARWFFEVGAASGTVARTISAYDMKFSDAIYGRSGRYVSVARLRAMLEHEYDLVESRLAADRGADTRFFAFADTASARNFAGTNLCHGWLGFRFQAEPQAEPNQIILHVNMHDGTNLQQQRAIGRLGVNLTYAAFFQREDRGEFLSALLDDLSLERVDVDFIEVEGPEFAGLDPRLLNIGLLRAGVSRAILLLPDGSPVAPVDILYKRPLAVERGAFKNAGESVYSEMMHATIRACQDAAFESRREPLGIFELTLNNLVADEETPDDIVLDRLDVLLGPGHTAMITTFPETYHLTQFFRRYSTEPLLFALGIDTLVRILESGYYADLPGGLVEAMGRMMANHVRLAVFPMSKDEFESHLNQAGQDLALWRIPHEDRVTVDNLLPRGALKHLYLFLRESGALVGM